MTALETERMYICFGKPWYCVKKFNLSSPFKMKYTIAGENCQVEGGGTNQIPDSDMIPPIREFLFET